MAWRAGSPASLYNIIDRRRHQPIVMAGHENADARCGDGSGFTPVSSTSCAAEGLKRLVSQPAISAAKRLVRDAHIALSRNSAASMPALEKPKQASGRHDETSGGEPETSLNELVKR